MEEDRHWVLWDGNCGLCAAAAAWVARGDRAGQLAVVAWQVAPSPPMSRALATACQQAVQVVTRDGTVLAGAEAVAFVLGEVGWRRLAHLLSRPPLRWLWAWGYRWVAGHRRTLSRLLGLPATCSVAGPPAKAKRGA